MATKPIKRGTSKRTPHTRNTGPNERAMAKINAAENLSRAKNRDADSTIFGLREEAGKIMADSMQKKAKPKSKPNTRKYEDRDSSAVSKKRSEGDALRKTIKSRKGK